MARRKLFISFASATGTLIVLSFVSHVTEWSRSTVRAQQSKLDWNCHKNDCRIEANATYFRNNQAIMIGAAKCGTYALRHFLNLSSHVVIPAEQESNFFVADKQFKMGIEKYRSFFPPITRGMIALDKSPGYFPSRTAALRIKQTFPNAKLIVILCDPVYRAYSHWRMLKSTDGADPSKFHDYVTQWTRYSPREITSILSGPDQDILGIGVYHEHLRTWLKLFPREHILILDGENFIRDPLAVTRVTLKFLGLDDTIEESNLYREPKSGFLVPLGVVKQIHKGDTRGKESPRMKQESMELLRKYYRPANEQLFNMLQRSFNWTK